VLNCRSAIRAKDSFPIRPGALAVVASLGLAATIYALRYRSNRLNIEAAKLAALVGALSGARVAEVGAGRGAMAFRVAKRLGPTGLLIATDSDPARVRGLQRKARKLTPKNITVLPGTPEGSELPPGSVTAVYLRGAYHHLTKPGEMNRSLFAALRPGGVLAIIDFPPLWLLAPWTPKGIPENRGGHGIREDIVIDEVTRAGFRLLHPAINWPGSMYCLLFQKP